MPQTDLETVARGWKARDHIDNHGGCIPCFRASVALGAGGSRDTYVEQICDAMRVWIADEAAALEIIKRVTAA